MAKEAVCGRIGVMEKKGSAGIIILGILAFAALFTGCRGTTEIMVDDKGITVVDEDSKLCPYCQKPMDKKIPVCPWCKKMVQ